MADSVSNDNNGPIEPSYEERDTPERCDTISLAVDESTESASDLQVTVASHSSPAFFVNVDNNADAGNSSAIEMRCPHCSKVSKSQGEIDIHIREKHPADDIAERSSCSSDEESIDDESDPDFVPSGPTPDQEDSVKGLQCSSCGMGFTRKENLKRHLFRFRRCRTRERHSTEAELYVCGTRVYECHLCERGFTKQDFLTRHIDRMHNRPHPCRQCDQRFPTKEDLQLHKPIHNQQNCPYCSQVFPLRNELLKHVAHAHEDEDLSESNGCKSGEGRISFTQTELDAITNGHVSTASALKKKHKRKAMTCWICQKKLYSNFALTRHIQAHTGEKTYPCDHCDKYFANEKDQQCHLKYLNLERRFKCEQCGKAFKTQSSLNIHLTRHGSEKPFKCPHCPKSYKFDIKLREHVRVHTGEKPYECRRCDEAFANLRQRGQHELIKHNVGSKEYKCKHCSEIFKTPSLLWIHSTSHTAEVLRCEHCPYVTKIKHRMTRHKIKHTKEKPYSYDQCSKRFTQVSRFHIHLRSHTGEKPYACQQCEKAFVDSYSLKRHTRTHTGEKPYKCNCCSKSFAQGCQRQFHERTHTGEKPYECSQCEKKFTRRQELSKHLQTHKKGKQPVKKKRKVVEDLKK